MSFVSAGIGVARKRHAVLLSKAAPPVPDGDGQYTEASIPLSPPSLSVEIRTAGDRDLERLKAGTVSATATHVLTGDYHPGITTETRITFGSRVFSVVGFGTPDEARAEVELYCSEQVS